MSDPESPELRWQTGKTADLIEFVGRAEAYIQNAPGDPVVHLARVVVERLKSGALTMVGLDRFMNFIHRIAEPEES